MPEYEYVNCDFCGEADARTVYSQADWDGLCPGDFALVKCARCGLIYLNPRPTVQTMEEYYPDDYAPYQKAIEDEPWSLMRWFRRRKMIRRREFIQKWSNKTAGCILDVGCATGIFLNEMKISGWQAKGVELSASAAEYARKKFGLDVFTGFLEDSGFPKESFDVITFWDVLEHVTSAKETLKVANGLLKEGGIVVINIPNWRSLDRKIFGPYWIGLDPPRHLFVFDWDDMDRFLQETGFDVFSRATVIHPYFSTIISLNRYLTIHFPKVAPLIDRVLNFPGMRLLFEPIYFLLGLCNYGGVITIAAKKTRVV